MTERVFAVLIMFTVAHSTTGNTATNVAIGKPSKQTDTANGLGAAFGNDNNTNTCMETTSLDASWELDLGGLFKIEYVIVRGKEEEQWVSNVIGFSSQYSNESHSAQEILGAPNVYPTYEASSKGWLPNGSHIDANQFLEFQFATLVFVSKVDVYETYNAGGVKAIKCLDYITGKWITLWSTTEVSVIYSARIFSPLLRSQEICFSNHIRLDIDCTVGVWVMIDAVRLHGYQRYSPLVNLQLSVAWSPDEYMIVDYHNGIHAGDEDKFPLLSLSFGVRYLELKMRHTWSPLKLCEVWVLGYQLYCEEAPCQNDGTCDNQQNGYTCACTQGWTGPICDQEEEQWVSNVIGFSSQYSNESHSAQEILGAPNVYPTYEASSKGWLPNGSHIDANQFLEFQFATLVFVSKVDVYETYNAGGVKAIKCLDYITGKWITLWSTTEVSVIYSARIFSPLLRSQEICFSNHIRLDIDCTVGVWVMIDAVRLHGYQRYSPLVNLQLSVAWSPDEYMIVDYHNGIHAGDEDKFPLLSLSFGVRYLELKMRHTWSPLKLCEVWVLGYQLYCEEAPCQNDGTCDNQQNGYTCACTQGWTGPICDQDIDECATNPCKNGATCINGQNTYTCWCAGGWQGTNCDQDIDECSNGPCQNGGTCINGQNSFTCICGDGFSGNTCQNVVENVYGQWGPWSDISECSVTCGEGIAWRARTCNKPRPANGAPPCKGSALLKVKCMNAKCPSAGFGSSYVNKCPKNYFTCASGGITCIEDSFVCDCSNDCDDSSDEQPQWAGCQSFCAGKSGAQGKIASSLTMLMTSLLVVCTRFFC